MESNDAGMFVVQDTKGDDVVPKSGESWIGILKATNNIIIRGLTNNTMTNYQLYSNDKVNFKKKIIEKGTVIPYSFFSAKYQPHTTNR